MTKEMLSGPKLAALYGLIPNQLGFCGPRQEKLRNFIAGKITMAQIIPILKQFEAAYPYYQLIARANRAKPFDKKVVEAYWLGNEYLDKVTIADLRQLIIDKFSAPGLLPKEVAIKKAAVIPPNSKPHHSFHVMVLGSVTGRVNFAGDTKLQDICRVSWGKVEKINAPLPPLNLRGGEGELSPLRLQPKKRDEKNKLIVRYQPLTGVKNIKLGQPVKKEIIWDKDMIPKLKIGDWVSVHWGHTIQILSMSDINNLKKYTQNTLNALK